MFYYYMQLRKWVYVSTLKDINNVIFFKKQRQ